jgi:hypothetical protein
MSDTQKTDTGLLPAPGIYRDIAEHIYRAWPYPSQSSLKLFEKRSAAHARYDLLHPKPPTRAREVGSAMHVAQFEPKRFTEEYIAAPAGMDRRTKKGKADWAELEKTGRTILLADEYEHIAGLSFELWAHPVASELLGGEGVNEVSIVWDEHADAGPVRCKARLDRLTYYDGWPTVVDLKKTRDASPRSFIWDIGRYGYHVQAAMYLRALEIATKPLERRFVILAVEDDPPHGVKVYELDESSLAEAQAQLFDCLEQWARCVKTGEWPGYTPEIYGVTLPEKYWRKS